ncbi:hypothetical protein GQX74_003246 [Glossina fuscipes]|nr:hypothetical protein GQX74_003246 [Glossina fuscipes]
MQLSLFMIFGLIIKIHDLDTVGGQLPCPNNYLFGCQTGLQPVPCEQVPPNAALPPTSPTPVQLLFSLMQGQPLPQLQFIYHHSSPLLGLPAPPPICRSSQGAPSKNIPLHRQLSHSLSNKDSHDDQAR